MVASSIVPFRDGPNKAIVPPLSYVTILEPPSQVGNKHLGDLTPIGVRQILDEAEGGKLERWNWLAEKMLEDEHLSGVVGTRIDSVARAPWILEPGDAEPGQEAAAAEAVKLCEAQLKSTEDLERLFADLLHGTMNGLQALEHDWYRKSYRGMRGWFSRPFWTPPKEYRYAKDWQVQVRTKARTWTDLPPGKFILHTPRTKATIPTKTALLRAAVWPWLYKVWAWVFWVNGAERHGNPLMLGKMPANAHESVIKVLKEALQNLSEGQIAVLEKETDIEFPTVDYRANAEVWDKLISKSDLGISKAILGSTLNTEITDTGGAYAAAESQTDTTITPRLESDAAKLGGTIGRDWLAPFLSFNAHLTNGVVAPTPRLKFQLRDPSKKQINPQVFTALVNASAIRVNELREMAGMEKLSAAEGGEDFVRPAVAAAWADAWATQGARTSEPAAEVPQLPFASTFRKPTKASSSSETSPTATGSASPLARLLTEASDALSPWPTTRPPKRSRSSKD